jgi:hypothetical protein
MARAGNAFLFSVCLNFVDCRWAITGTHHKLCSSRGRFHNGSLFDVKRDGLLLVGLASESIDTKLPAA